MPFRPDAGSLCGILIDAAPPGDGQGLCYNAVANMYILEPMVSVGGLVFQDNWNADTNTPDLTTSPPDAGKFWYVAVAGTTNLGGITDWGIGDWAVSKGEGAWIKVDNTEVTRKARFVIDFHTPTAGGASEGFIDGLPVYLFVNTAEREIIGDFKMPSDFDGVNNPSLSVTLLSTDVPTATEGIVFRYELRYVGIGETPGKAIDETVTITTDPLPYLVANTLQIETVLSLDASKIAAGDIVYLTVTRETGAAADDYGGDIGMSRDFLIQYTVA